MPSQAHGQIVEALHASGMEMDVAHQVATALTIETDRLEHEISLGAIETDRHQRSGSLAITPTQQLEHKGTLAITNTLPEKSRNFSQHSGSKNLKPVPPVEPPSITRGLLELTNAPRGLSDRRGENGYALRIRQGNFVNQGASHILRHAQVQATTTVTDSRATELNTALVTDTYYVADCLECSDGKGRGLSSVPIRVFCKDEDNQPNVGEVIRYLHDTDGLAWRLAENTNLDVRWAKATTGWTWRTEDEVGQVVCIDADDIDGNTSGYTTSRIEIRATSAQDPNVQPNDVIAYQVDNTGQRVVADGYGLDAKIHTLEMWHGEPNTIKGGWKRFAPMDQRVPVGYEPGDCDYDPQGSTGGSHPIRPKEHAYTEPSSSTSKWQADDCHGTYYETAWILRDHEPELGSSNTTGLSVGAASLAATTVSIQISVSAATGDTDSGGTTITGTQGITITGSPTIGSTSLSATGSVSVSATSLWLGGTPSISSTALSGMGVTGSITVGTTSLGLTGSPSIGSTSVPVSGTIDIATSQLTATGSVSVTASAVTITGAPSLTPANEESVGGSLTVTTAQVSATGSVSMSEQAVTILGNPSCASSSPALSGSITILAKTSLTGSGTASAGNTSLSVTGDPYVAAEDVLGVTGALTCDNGSPNSATGSVTIDDQSLSISGDPAVQNCSAANLDGSLTVNTANVLATGSVTIVAADLDIIGTSAVGNANVSIDDHPPHTHKLPVLAEAFDKEIGGTIECVEHDSYSSTNTAQAHTNVTDAGHDHDAGNLELNPNPHIHGTSGFSVTVADHNHSLTNSLKMPAHDHPAVKDTLAVDPALHDHTASSFSVTIDPHSHNVGITSLEAAGHEHDTGAGGLAVSPGSHGHAITINSISVNDHDHTADISGLGVASHTHVMGPGGLYGLGHDHTLSGFSVTVDDHNHSVTDNLTVPEHTHAITKGGLTGASHAHAATVDSITIPAHGHGVDSYDLSADSHTHTWVKDDLAIPDHDHLATENLTVLEFSHSHGAELNDMVIQSGLGDDIHGHSATVESITIDEHGHGWSKDTLAVTPNPHSHTVAQHVHGLGSHTHSTSASSSIGLEHTHSVEDLGHQHSSPTLAHTGYLYHRTEDFRMKWLATIFIERVGPDDD